MSQPVWQPPSLTQMQAALPAFRFEEIIGRGGMGAVYKATELSLRRTVAIKVLPADLMEDAEAFYAERFEQEARTMAQLNHPGLVRVFDFGKTADGLLFFVMEYVEGTDLERLIRECGKFPPEQALDLTVQICRALDYAHRRCVVHRDIKPANLLLTRDGQVKIADFGLAKHQGATALGLTKSSVAVGTPDYLAPEAWTPGTALDGRADLFAVGVVLYQMLTGRVPRGLWAPASECAGTDPRFDAVIDRAVQPEREARFAAAEEIIADLEAIRSGPAAPPLKKPRWKWRVVGAAGAAAILAGLLLLLLPPKENPARLPTLVTITGEDGPGSLRQAMENSDLNPGPDTITFAPELAGKVIVLSKRPPRLMRPDALKSPAARVPGGPLHIDGSTVPGGVIVSAAHGFFFAPGDETAIRHVTFTGCRAPGRNPIGNFGRLRLEDCTFTDNAVTTGGGAIFNVSSGSIEMLRCRFTGNTSQSNGGAIHNLGTITMTDCTFTGNRAGGGGAIAHDAGELRMTNCTFTENEATGRGGAMAALQGSISATRCTVQRNSATGIIATLHGGGGIYLTDPAEVHLDGCLVSANTAASGSGPNIWNQSGRLHER